MIQIEHNLKFITEVDETHPIGATLVALPTKEQTVLLEALLKDLVGSKLGPILAEINERGTYAILKVAE